MKNVTEEFLQKLHNTFTENQWLTVAYVLLIVIIAMYLFMWFNLAYIPYSTAWDANHAYLFFPRSWALNNWIYWADAGAIAMPNIRYWFLTFWYKIAATFWSWLLGISPDWLAVVMNFFSGPLSLLAFWFLLHTFLQFLQDHHKEKKCDKPISSNFILWVFSIWMLLMVLWLTSGMGAFLLFVDNKTDMAVMFFGILALYAWIQFMRTINGYAQAKNDENFSSSDDAHVYTKKAIVQYTIISAILFTASAVAKSTWMFDIAHFAILLLMQWQVILFGVGAYMWILWVLGLSQMLLVGWFITPSMWRIFVAIWAVLIVLAILFSLKKKWAKEYLRYFLLWAAVIIAGIFLYKAPYILGVNAANWWKFDIKWFVRGVLFSRTVEVDKKPVLLATTASVETLESQNIVDATVLLQSWEIVLPKDQPAFHSITKEMCLAEPTDTDKLYSWLKEALGNAQNEDFWRYIWYWWKEFKDVWVFSVMPSWCYSFHADAKYLCEHRDEIDSIKYADLEAFLGNMPSTKTVQWWQDKIANYSWEDTLEQTALVAEIKAYMQANSILQSKGDKNMNTYVPYKYIIPFNSTFNWSLQNLSSYYTDIGIIWLFWLFIAILWLLYGLITSKRQLVVVSLVNLGAWATWMVVASGIMWYSLWLILWIILGMVAYFYYLYRNVHKSTNTFDRMLMYILAWSFLFICFFQLLLNFIRISSQWGGGPFVWYKGNIGEQVVITDDLQQETKDAIGYSAKDVFDLQFPHYNPILSKVNAREKGEWVMVAGTYMQYFMNSQRKVSYDWFLTEFWKNASDNNVCNTYKRLVDKDTKYLVIDPNIASVVMDEQNSTLMDRFFAVVDSNGNLLQHWALSMLQALVQDWYMEMYSTNNIVTKYAFIIPDEQLAAALSVPVGDRLLLERARMSAPRYFPKIEAYANVAAAILSERVQTFDAISDIADILWKEINEEELVSVAKLLAQGGQSDINEALTKTKDLTNDEKLVLQYFLGVYQSRTQAPTTYRQYISQLITTSLTNGSQVMAFEVK